MKTTLQLFFLFAALTSLGQSVGVRISTNTALTQGDQVIWSGSAWVTYGKGTNGQVLTMDGTNVVWATPSGGGGGGSGTVTSVGASTTVSGLGFSVTSPTTTPSLSLTGVVAVASGGTGGTNAATARSNLGVLSSRWLTGFGSPSDYSEGIGTYYVNLETYQVWEQTGVSTFETIPFFVMGEGVYSYLDQPNTFANTNTFAGPVVLLSGISGNGTLLTNLNGTEIRSGTVAAARIDSAMATDAEVTAATAEATLEAVLDLQDLQGAVTDAQVPNTITVDIATTATTANSGDSATAFFSSGEIEDARLPSGLSRDSEVSATYAPLASPALTGSPTVPTASAASSNTVVASTAYVDRAVAAGGGGGGTWDGTPIASGTITNLTTSSISLGWYTITNFPGYYSLFEDVYSELLFTSTAVAAPFTGASFASGTFTAGSGEIGHNGVWRAASAGSVNGGYSLVHGGAGAGVAISGGERFETIFKLLNTNGCMLSFGFGDNSATIHAGTDVISIRVGRTAGSYNTIEGVCRFNSTETVTATSYGLATNVWYVTGGYVDPTLTNVTFYLKQFSDLSTLWTDSVVTNIPNGGTRLTSLIYGGSYTNTSTAIFDMDSIYYRVRRR